MPDLRTTNPLSSGDALFLYLERQGQPVNIAAVCTFDGIIPLDLCTDYVETKLPLIPRYLQRVVAPPLDLGLPTWEYDPCFDIHHHVREVTLKRGTENEFKKIAGEVIGSNFDRTRPLWDFTLVRGLKGNRTGLIIRLHHCLADGISGVGIMKTLLDPSPLPPELPKQKQVFHAPPLRTKSLFEGMIDACVTFAERSFNVQCRLLEMAQYAVAGAPASDNRGLNDAVVKAAPLPDLAQIIGDFASPTYRLPFNVVCKGPQKYNCAAIPLDEMKAVKNACEATINDVVLALVSDVIRRHAELHGRDLTGRSVRIIVPMNLRSNGETGLGNNITFLPVNVPLYIREPFQLVQAVREAMAVARKAHMAEVIGIIGTLVEAVPTPLQAMLLPILSELPLSVANTIITNVPGPPLPLYLLGHKMLTCYPYVPIGGEMGMNTAVISYNGMVYFGFGGDAHAIPDVRVLDRFLAASFAELKRGAGIASPKRRRPRSKAPELKAAVRVTSPLMPEHGLNRPPAVAATRSYRKRVPKRKRVAAEESAVQAGSKSAVVEEPGVTAQAAGASSAA